MCPCVSQLRDFGGIGEDEALEQVMPDPRRPSLVETWRSRGTVNLLGGSALSYGSGRRRSIGGRQYRDQIITLGKFFWLKFEELELKPNHSKGLFLISWGRLIWDESFSYLSHLSKWNKDKKALQIAIETTKLGMAFILWLNFYVTKTRVLSAGQTQIFDSALSTLSAF